MDAALPPSNQAQESLRAKVRSAVIWRSGSQILSQLVQWAATFLVIRILEPADYGLYAMAGVVLAFLNLLNGYSLASGLIRQPTITRAQVRQLFGMLLLLNLGLGIVQFAAAPLVAAYYRQPEVTAILRVQCLLYLATPFIALPYALLAREMEFAAQARINVASAIASAAAALGGAVAGLGVWTLVWAPVVLFGVRAIGMTWAAGSLMWPSFAFRGAGQLARFGGLMAAGQFFWFAQSQADVLIAGRWFDAHAVGLYTTALFLTQIFQNKVVPPLNEVAFSAYARLQAESGAVGR
ncbi:MAG TPA: oligosaccharide flippase family protein, partial [Devosia sp.]